MDLVLEKALEEVKRVDNNRDYWFIRSYSGELFESFYNNGYVGLGLNNVPYELITNAINEKGNTFDSLVEYIDNNTIYNDSSAKKWANQLVRFEHEVKEGDVIITPSRNSSRFAIGIVKGGSYLVKSQAAFKFNGDYEPYPEKRKKVDWLKIMSKEVLQGEFRNLTSTHQAITKANDYRDVIEGNLSSLYIRNERIYLTIRIDQDEEINAFELNRFLTSLTFFYKEFCKEYGIEENEDLTIKIKLQSKGKLAVAGFSLLAGFGLASLVLLSNNSELSAKYNPETKTGEFNFKSDGLLTSISDFLDRRQERKIQFEIFNDSRQKLKVKPIEEGIEDDSLTSDSIKVEEVNKSYIIEVQHRVVKKDNKQLPEH